MRKVGLELTPEFLRLLEELAAERGVTIEQVIREAIRAGDTIRVERDEDEA